MRIWIDTTTGTWGDLGSLAIADIPEVGEEWMAVASDSEITDYARAYGRQLSGEGTDNEDQLVLYFD